MEYWTGIAGILTFALAMVEIPLYFVHSGAPPAKNVLTRVLVNMLLVVALTCWPVGFRRLIFLTHSDYAWLGTLCLVLGVIHVSLTLAAKSIEGGSVLGRFTRVDPTLIGSGGEGALLIYGPISRLLEAAFLGAAGSAMLLTGVVPAWIGWLAYVLSILEAAFVPTMFSGTDPDRFYSVNGWGVPVAGGLFLAWILVISVPLLTR